MTWIRRAISPVIATVIIVAIAIAIAVAVVGWLTGLWSSLAGGTPAIAIPSAFANVSDDNLYVYMYIRNDGSGSDKIIRIDVEFQGNVTECPQVYDQTNGKLIAEASTKNPVVNLPGATIKANAAGWINTSCTIKGWNVAPGDKIIVRVHLEKSGVIPLNVVIRSVKSRT